MKPQHPESARTETSALGERISALFDDHLDRAELDVVLTPNRQGFEVHDRFHVYGCIGDVLRGEHRGDLNRHPADLLASLHAALAEDAPLMRSAELESALSPPVVRAPAANDPVFRWKMVSGFASFAAVAAIGWNIMATAPGSSVDATRLAQDARPGAAAVQAVVPAQTAPSEPVVISTGQGTVIRDAALERLLAEHRQHGGMSALQNPTGFIRNATYDAQAR